MQGVFFQNCLFKDWQTSQEKRTNETKRTLGDKNANLYATAVSGKLKLKGESSSSKHKKSKKSKKRKHEDEGAARDIDKEDMLSHAGGWVVDKFEQITGTVFIELQEFMYMHGLDNGVFVLGAPHEPGDRPDTCELFTAVRVDDKHVALKSAYGKYLSVNSNGLVVGRSDAISPKEYFEIEIDYDYDGRKIYVKASNGNYVSANGDGDMVALREKKEENEVRIRSLNKREDDKAKASKELPSEEQTEDMRNVELNYVKKFQKFQDKKIRLCPEDTSELAEAKVKGELHEKLLDRREKMKSDRYCK